MRKILALALLGLPLVFARPASTAVCDLEPTPAATLLLPYFEVGDGTTTLFSINNAGPEPVLALVTLWTDWGAPTLRFNVFLTGFDVVRVNLADVFEGYLPITADARNDPGDEVSPAGGAFVGPKPEWDGSFPDCDAHFPLYVNPLISGASLERLVDSHTGRPVAVANDLCLGADHGDGVARGYATIDSVDRCALDFMDDPDFFAEEGGIANHRNVLWGDYFLIDDERRYAEGNTLVHVEAAGSIEEIPTGNTFYGRFAAGGADRREPLGSVWAVPYLANTSIGAHTDLLVWRDPTVGDLLQDGVTCGDRDTPFAGPDWFPLDEVEVVAFDEAESAVTLCFLVGGAVGTPDDNWFVCFPYATGRYRWNEGLLDSPFAFGWAWLNLNLARGEEGRLAQSHVTALHRAEGYYSVGAPAVKLESACGDANPSLAEEWYIPFF